jgi:hypothetical protein
VGRVVRPREDDDGLESRGEGRKCVANETSVRVFSKAWNERNVFLFVPKLQCVPLPMPDGSPERGGAHVGHLGSLPQYLFDRPATRVITLHSSLCLFPVLESASLSEQISQSSARLPGPRIVSVRRAFSIDYILAETLRQ